MGRWVQEKAEEAIEVKGKKKRVRAQLVGGIPNQ